MTVPAGLVRAGVTADVPDLHKTVITVIEISAIPMTAKVIFDLQLMFVMAPL